MEVKNECIKELSVSIFRASYHLPSCRPDQLPSVLNFFRIIYAAKKAYSACGNSIKSINKSQIARHGGIERLTVINHMRALGITIEDVKEIVLNENGE